MGRFAIIGWGSLIWDLEALEPHVRGAWRMEAGPRLPMEFSRISPKRKMGLVVCLDPVHGEGCPTHVIRSTRRNLPGAIKDLALRERAHPGWIGAVDTAGHRHGRMPEVIDMVGVWCAANGIDGAVWTDLEPNFADHTGDEFSIPRGHAYLQTLGTEGLAEAHRYITNAPAQTSTPMRRFLEADPWWRAQGRSRR